MLINKPKTRSFPKYPAYRTILLSDKDTYDYFYYLHGVPCSDYCFSVIKTWLEYGGTVKASVLKNGLLLLRYVDVLDNDHSQISYTLIGSPSSIDNKVVSTIVGLADNKSVKVIITEPHVEFFKKFQVSSYELIEEPGFDDYLYSVKEYADLSSSTYRRFRREINIFKREYKTTPLLKEQNMQDSDTKSLLINAHHMWDNTYKYNNDPDRIEGLIIAKMVEIGGEIGEKCFVIYIKDHPEGFLIYTELDMKSGKYINLHHARFSNNYKYLNDFTFHLLSEELEKKNIEYINFERDADVEGLRKHKQLLKPCKMIRNYSLSKM